MTMVNLRMEAAPHNPADSARDRLNGVRAAKYLMIQPKQLFCV